LGALTSKIYAFSYRSWEFHSFFRSDLFDIVNTPLRVDMLNNSIIRILPRLNDTRNKVSDWIADKSRFVYDALQKQRFLSPLKSEIIKEKILVKKLVPFSLYVILTSLHDEMRELKECSVDFLFGHFFDLSILLIINKFLIFLGPYRVLFSSLREENFIYDFREDFLSIFMNKEDFLFSYDFLLLIGLNLRLVSPFLFSQVRLIRKKKNSFIGVFGGFFDRLVFYNFNFGLKTLNFLNFLTGKHFLSRILVKATSILFLVGQQIFSFFYVCRSFF